MKCLVKRKFLKVTFDGKKCTVLEEAMHLPRDVSFFPAYAVQQRLRSIQKIQNRQLGSGLSFSAMFSGDQQTFYRLERESLEYLKKIERLGRDSNPKQVFQLTLDCLHM